MKAFAEKGHSVSEINLSKYNIQTCRGCRICFDNGEDQCPLKDDVKDLYNRMKQYDLVVWGSPVYVEDINGIMKNYIDRLAFNSHRPSFYKSRSYIICTSGSGSSNHPIKTMQRAMMTWGFQNIGNIKFITGATITEKDFIEKYEKKLTNQIIHIDKKMHMQAKPNFISLLTYYIQKKFYLYKMDKMTFDYKYWTDNSWLQNNMHYYFPVKIGLLKRLIIVVLGETIYRLVSK
jgi:multimeric flavodoxin WrbA